MFTLTFNAKSIAGTIEGLVMRGGGGSIISLFEYPIGVHTNISHQEYSGHYRGLASYCL